MTYAHCLPVNSRAALCVLASFTRRWEGWFREKRTDIKGKNTEQPAATLVQLY